VPGAAGDLGRGYPGVQPQRHRGLARRVGRFRAAIESRAQRYDLLALEAQNAVRLITTSKYPPLRGTRFTIGTSTTSTPPGYIAGGRRAGTG